jgi:hypothetical protein
LIRTGAVGGLLVFARVERLQRQAAKIAADQVTFAQGDHGDEEQREPALRLQRSKDGWARALGTGILNLADGLLPRTQTKEKKHIALPS